MDRESTSFSDVMVGTGFTPQASEEQIEKVPALLYGILAEYMVSRQTEETCCSFENRLYTIPHRPLLPHKKKWKEEARSVL